MTLFEALVLIGNSAWAGVWLSRGEHWTDIALGCISAVAVVILLIARFA